MPRQEGQFLVSDYFNLSGGLNTADSPFIVGDNEAIGGTNFDLLVPGSFRKRGGHVTLNTVADTQLKTLGVGLWNKPSATRVPVRAAGVKLQNFDPSAFTLTDLYEDTQKTTVGTATVTIATPGVVTFAAHGLSPTDPVVFSTTGALPTGLTAGTTYFVKSVLTVNTFTLAASPGGTVINTTGSQSGTHTLYKFNTTFLNAGSTQPVVFNMYNTPASGILWAAGGGESQLYGVVSSTQVTANGVPAPTASSFTAVDGTPASTPLQSGVYFYTLVYRKTSTQAFSNAGSDASVTAVAGDSVIVSWTLSNNDTVKYDQLYLYRSSLGGVAGFTAGSLIAQLAITAITYTDLGTSIADSQVVPRVNNTVIDNSQLPSGTFTTIATMKRRLVTASKSTVYFSDVNKSESWPTFQNVIIPSGGDITGLGVIGLTSPLSTDITEALVVFKQGECWAITGDGTLDSVTDIPNWSLQFVSNAGSSGQASIISAEGYLLWINYRGFYGWNGSGKPVGISRKIWDKFQASGDIDKSKLGIAFGFFSQKRNEAQFYLSSTSLGEQRICLRLDLTHTLKTSAGSGIGDQQMDGVFLPDTLASPMYGGMGCLLAPDSTDETIYLGDSSGFMYSGFTGTGDGVAGVTPITMQYVTPNFHLGKPNVSKVFNKVVVWVLDNGLYNVSLNFWTNYLYQTADASAQILASDPNPVVGSGIWDVGKWDQMTWDAAPSKPRSLTFNLFSASGNTQGDTIKLALSQTGTTQSPLIYGFSIYYTEKGLVKG